MIMRIPYVIDNHTHKFSDVLNALLAEHVGHSLDVATAYFNVGSHRLLGKQLEQLRSFRLLLGFQPSEGRDLGLRPRAEMLKAALRGDLDAAAITPP